MAHSPELKTLEERRKTLVAQNDVLRQALAARCAELGSASFWAQQGVELAQRILASHSVLSTLSNLFGKSRS
jgi:hypothetical protein